jgi:fermentation-respiration switch protein FrsA (DUF1100 family)
VSDLALPSKRTLVVGGLVLTGAALLAWLLWPKRPRRIALIGDSLAVGLGPQLAKLAAAAGVPFQYQGQTGSTVAQWLATPSWGAWVPSFGPSTTLIELGTNDYLNPSPSLAQYRQLAGKFPNAVWIMPPDEPKAPMPQVRAVINQVGVPVIPEATGLSYGADGIHPSNYAAWAAFVWARTP